MPPIWPGILGPIAGIGAEDPIEPSAGIDAGFPIGPIIGIGAGGDPPITIGRTGMRSTRVCDDGSSLARFSGRRAPPINRSPIYPCPIPRRLPTMPARLVGGVPYAYRW